MKKETERKKCTENSSDKLAGFRTGRPRHDYKMEIKRKTVSLLIAGQNKDQVY